MGQIEKIFDAYDHIKYFQKNKNDREADTSVMHININYLNEYLNHLLELKIAALTDMRNNNFLRSKAINLISLISREYDLK